MKTRVDLLFTYDFPPMGGGIARWMEAIAREHPPGSLIVSTGTLQGAGALDARLPVAVDRVPVAAGRLRTLPGVTSWSRRAAVLAADRDARFGWCGNVRPAIYPAAYAHWRTGLPFGVIVHGGDLLTLRRRLRIGWKRTVMRRMMASAAVFVANSRWTADACEQLLVELGVGTAVRVIPLGTDPRRFRPDPLAGAAFRATRGIAPGPLMLTVARLVPHKGIDTAMHVLAALMRDVPDLQYVVVGRGPDESRLRALAAALGLTARLHILSDVSDDELPGAYGAASVYVGLSREEGVEVEGFGIALLEAAASGLPVVAGASGGTSDAVADGITGALVKPLDIGAAVEATRGLLGAAGRAHEWGIAGRARVLEHFTWSRVVTEMRTIAHELGRP